MLNKIEIKNNKDIHPHFKFISNLPFLKNGKCLNFNSGINIIIGPNGSGKSTLFKIIYQYLFLNKNFKSTIPNQAFEFPDIFNNDDGIYKGIKINADYKGVFFKYTPSLEIKKDENVMSSFENFGLYLNSVNASIGEQTIIALNSLFREIFKKQNYNFPIKKLIELKDSSNDTWKSRFQSLLSYYKENQFEIKNKEDYEYTILLDEPDRNLDIENIEQIYLILSHKKPNTQIVAIIHNPILIYKLSKLKNINWIETEKDYLRKVKNIIED